MELEAQQCAVKATRISSSGGAHRSFFSVMADEGDSAAEFSPFTPEQLQWIDRLITARTEQGVANPGENPTSASGPSPTSLVVPSAGSLASTVTTTDTLVTPASRGGK